MKEALIPTKTKIKAKALKVKKVVPKLSRATKKKRKKEKKDLHVTYLPMTEDTASPKAA